MITEQDISESDFINNRPFVDYMELCGFSEIEMATFAEKLDNQSDSLGRPLVIGDVGCGNGTAIRAFSGDPKVRAYGIDMNASKADEDNIQILLGDALDNQSDFWSREYDLLFSVHLWQHITPAPDINNVIDLFRKHLSDTGQAYIVVPQKQAYLTRPDIEFNRSNIKRENVEVKVTVDPKTNQTCYALSFNKN